MTNFVRFQNNGNASFGVLEGIFEPSSIPQLPIEEISLNNHNIYCLNGI